MTKGIAAILIYSALATFGIWYGYQKIDDAHKVGVSCLVCPDESFESCKESVCPLFNPSSVPFSSESKI